VGEEKHKNIKSLKQLMSVELNLTHIYYKIPGITSELGPVFPIS